MTSGSPKKKARQMRMDEVRTAVAQGKTAVLTPWPNTEVTIRTTNPDYAESVVSFIEIMDPANRDLAHITSLIALLDMFLSAYMIEDRFHGHISRWLTQAQADLRLMQSGGSSQAGTHV